MNKEEKKITLTEQERKVLMKCLRSELVKAQNTKPPEYEFKPDKGHVKDRNKYGTKTLETLYTLEYKLKK